MLIETSDASECDRGPQAKATAPRQSSGMSRFLTFIPGRTDGGSVAARAGIHSHIDRLRSYQQADDPATGIVTLKL
jgi:hypothetical protein